jgi:hypothetical protein
MNNPNKDAHERQVSELTVTNPEFNFIFTVDLGTKIDFPHKNAKEGNNKLQVVLENFDQTDNKQLRGAGLIEDSFIDKTILCVYSPKKDLFEKLCDDLKNIKPQQSSSDSYNFCFSMPKTTSELRGVSVKVFSIGTISIIIKIKPDSDTDINIPVEDVVELIKHPENLNLYSEQQNETHSGELLYAIKKIGEKVYTSFCTEFDKKILKHCHVIAPDKLEYIKFSSVAPPYIGTLIQDNEFEAGKEDEGVEGDDCPMGRRYVALSTCTPAHIHEFKNAAKFLRKRTDEVSQRNEYFVVERRSWLLVIPQQVEECRYRYSVFENTLFCFETIFAASMAVKRYNHYLDREIYHETTALNTLLQNVDESKVNDLTQINSTLTGLISKARLLSPCEDITTAMESYVSSTNMYNVIKIIRSFSLDELITLAQKRMGNNTAFLKTGREIVNDNRNLQLLNGIKGVTDSINTNIRQTQKWTTITAGLTVAILIMAAAQFFNPFIVKKLSASEETDKKPVSFQLSSSYSDTPEGLLIASK